MGEDDYGVSFLVVCECVVFFFLVRGVCEVDVRSRMPVLAASQQVLHPVAQQRHPPTADRGLAVGVSLHFLPTTRLLRFPINAKPCFLRLAAVRPPSGNSSSTTKQPSDQGINQRLAFLTLNASITKTLPGRDGFQRYHERHTQGSRHCACLHQQSCCIQYSPSSFGNTPQRFRERSRRINNECQQTEAVKER